MIAVSSPYFSHFSFCSMLEKISSEFYSWEIVAEGRHALQHIETEFLEYAPSYNLSFSAHAPMSDINIGSLNRNMLEASLNELIACMRSCNKLGIEVVTVHPGFMSPLGMSDKSKVIDITKASLFRLEAEAAELGVKIAFENMPACPMCMGTVPEDLLSLLEGTELGICFDIGHANTTNTVQEFLKLSDRFVNVHIHDNRGVSDEHLPIGKGTVDFSAVTKALGSRRYVIESRGWEDALESRDELRKLLNS